MAIKCCYGCVPPERHPGCHAMCQKYIEANEKHQAERKAMRKYLETDDSIYSQKRDGIARAYRSTSRRRK